MRVLLAPTLAGDDVSGLTLSSGHLAGAWSDAAPHDLVDLCALSDGGPGFAALVAARADAGTGRPEVWAAPGVLVVGGRGGTAYVDGSVGLRSGQGTAGLGEQLVAALSAAPSRVVLGLPGPDQTVVVPDAGWGMLGALGVEGVSAADVTAADLVGLADVLARLGEVDLVGAAARDLPLLGLHGASAAAGESGALTALEAQQLERAVGQLAHAVWEAVTAEPAVPTRPTAAHQSLLGTTRTSSTTAGPARRVRDVTGLPGAGAGAGAGWLVALAGGRLLPGAAVHADAVGLGARVAASDLVVTTIDHLDAATFHGSGAEQAATAAAAVGVPCVVVAGTSMMSRRESSAAGLSAVYVASEHPGRPADPSAADLAGVLARVARSWSPARRAR